MSELAAAEMFSPPAKNKTARAWRTVLGFLGFLFQILIQVLRGTPSLTQVLSFVGIRHPLLPSSSAAFRTLPADIPTDTPRPSSAVAAEQPLDKLMVVLDLDETLVCAYESSSLSAIVRNQAIEAGLKCFELECISTDQDLGEKPKVNYVTVFERPGLHEFLHQTSEFADLILFTAGLEGYARPLVDRIDVENRFSHRLYRPATVSTACYFMLFGSPKCRLTSSDKCTFRESGNTGNTSRISLAYQKIYVELFLSITIPLVSCCSL